MTNYFVYTIHEGISYEDFKKPLKFANDTQGLTNWVFRFPIIIYDAGSLQKHSFTQDSVTITSNVTTPVDEKWRYFVITRQGGNRVYCTAQVYYEKGIVKDCIKFSNGLISQKKSVQFYLPRCIILLSNQPYFKMHVNLLKIHRQLRKQVPNIKHAFSPKVISSYLSLKKEGRQNEWTNMEGVQGRHQPQIQLVMDFYLEKCNEHKYGEIIFFQKSSNWPILHLYKLNQSSLFQFSHFFNMPLSVDTMKSALISILLQKQIIVTSKSQNLNVMVIQSLLQLIKPLKWEHMLVHNLPTHLLEAADQNFMPFIIGVNKKYLPQINLSDKYLLIIDENKLISPKPLPSLHIDFECFPDQLSNSATPSHLNEKLVLQNSIEFMCKLLDPVKRASDEIADNNRQFFSQFYQSSLFIHFTQKYEKGQVKQFKKLNQLEGKERVAQIKNKLNETFQIVQNPRILNNEIAWIEYYIYRSKRGRNDSKSQFNGQQKQESLKEIKQSKFKSSDTINIEYETHQLKLTSQSHHQPTRNSSCRIGQKLKISMIKQERSHPMLVQLLEHKIGLSLPKNI